ncbi:putative lipoprotein [Rhizobium freirei PRF 81]|uniref:Putative lipoprotein n=1 Tax=Rhizobium freirei PRF 81 TaxID=363754 RepID=N6V3K4_9HYPH|nr:lipoprotein [Rhizobium freirei]ENN87676.1 putative lipoprotein [Rhizobium freirei PRF 81]
MKTVRFLAALAAASAFATVAFAAEPVKTVESAKGKVLAGENGKTLYTFKNDKAGESNCNGDCAKAWPPFMADSKAKAEGAYSIITRKDGMKQWAKDGMPLYFFSKDAKSGDVAGDGFKGVWNAARP